MQLIGNVAEARLKLPEISYLPIYERSDLNAFLNFYIAT
jgi:hypothetical protein